MKPIGFLGAVAWAGLLALAAAQGTASAPPVGTWQGTLSVGANSLPLLLHVRAGRGGLAVTLDSPAQGAFGLVGSGVSWRKGELSFDIASVGGHYAGRLGAGGKELRGAWSQGGASLPLDLRRVTAARAAPARAPLAGPALAAALDTEFAPLLRKGALGTGGGVVIGVSERGERQILAYGAALRNSIFEIGSITKTFTGLTLARMVEQRKVRLDESIEDLLPPGSVPEPRGPAINLAALATQHSALPRLPGNFRPAVVGNPYADYTPSLLLAFLRRHGVAAAPAAPFLYSNLGYGLLGYLLVRRAGTDYAHLVRDEVTAPLRLTDTVVHLSPPQQARLVAGHDIAGHAVPNWTFTDAMAGAGALRSTAADLLTYLEANLHPPAALAAGFALQHQLRAGGPGAMRVGLGWIYVPRTGFYWHDGGTGGYSSFAMFSPDHDLAIVVLYNRQDLGSGQAPLADRVAANVSQLVLGKPASGLE